MRYVNLPDLLLIALSAYIVVWGANHLLRSAGATDLQA